MFHSYLDCYLDPLLDLTINYGVYGSAHAQNIVLQFEDHLPVKCIFRDCQGTWYNPEVYDKLKAQIPALDDPNALVIDKEKSAELFTYYCIINACFNMLTALGQNNVVSEKELLLSLRKRLKAKAYENPSAIYDYLLERKTWQYKGNFMCTLDNLDEVSQSDPLRIYTPIKNPLYVEEKLQNAAVYSLRSNKSYKIALEDKKLKLSNDSENLVYNVSGNNEHVEIEVEDCEPSLYELLCDAAFILNRRAKSITRIESGERVSEISREDFYKNYRQSSYLSEVDKTIVPPSRPVMPEGLLYQRYFSLTDNVVTLETLDIEKHLEVFTQWHNQKRVSEFWELDKPQVELKEYVEKIKNDPHAHPVILSINGEPTGYFEIYWCLEDRLAPYYDVKTYDRGMHLLMGNEKYLGFENTYTAWVSLQHMLFLDDDRTEALMLEPRHDNKNIMKYAQVFKNITIEKEFDFPHKTAKLMRCDRKASLKEGYYNVR